MNVSNRLLTVPASPIRKLVPFATKAKKQGVNIYHLNIGDPDIKSPEVMINAFKSWNKNPIAYSGSQGEENLISSLTWYYHRLGYKFIKQENIQVTLGGSEAILITFIAICDPGDEILVFEPTYPNYLSLAATANVKLLPVATTMKTGFHLPAQGEIEKRINRKTKGILICNPNNPTGTVYTKREIDTVVKIAKKHNLFLIVDEVYREFCYQGKEHISILSYMKYNPDKIILLDSLSKRYSLCGLRLGCLVTLNNHLADGILRIAQGRLSAGTVDQYIAAKLTQVPKKYFIDNIKEYQKRRDMVFNQLLKVEDINVYKPEGAFYMIVGLPVKNSEDFCRWLLTDFHLNHETVMLAPGAGFYISKNSGKNEIRIAYVINKEKLKTALKILVEGLKTYKLKVKS